MLENLAYWDKESSSGIIPLSSSKKGKDDDAPADGDEGENSAEDFADDDEEVNDKDFDEEEE